MNNGASPLHCAAIRGSLKVMELLMAHQADPNARTNDGHTPLHCAIERNKPDAVSFLIARGADIEARSSQFPSRPLILAACLNHLECVKILLDNEASINTFEKEDAETPLPNEGFHSDVSSNFDGDSCAGFTPLLAASYTGHLEVVKLLIERGADVNQIHATENSGALHWAAMHNQEEVIKCLLHHGAYINLLNGMRMTPFHYCILVGSKVETLKLLLSHGARIDNDWDGVGMFWLACARGHINIVRWILEIGMSTETPIEDMVLKCEKHNGHAAIAEMLIARGLGPNEPGNSGAAPIFPCIEHGRLDLLEVLVKRRADLNILNKEGNVPLTVAAMAGNVDIISFLLKHGANLLLSQTNLVVKVVATSGDAGLLGHLAEQGLSDMIAEVSITCTSSAEP